MDNRNTSNHQAFQDDIFGSTLSKRELMLLREIDKQRIREEIITSGLNRLMRRRELEAEVIQEMLMEGQISARNDNIGLSLKDSLLCPELQGYVLGERQIGLGRQQQPVENYGRTEGGGVLGAFPFQCSPEAEKASRIATEQTKEFGKGYVIESTLDSDVSGMKRKSEATITKSVEDTPSLSLSKKLRQEYLEGRKHIAMEKAKTTEPVNKNADNTDASTEEADSSNEVGMNQAKPFPSVSLSTNMWELRCDMCQFNASSELHLKGHLEGRKHIAKEKAAAETTEPVNKNADNSNTLDSDVSGMKRNSEATITKSVEDTPSLSLSTKLNREWGCSLCQVTALCEKSLKQHFEGRKHRAMEKAKMEEADCSNEEGMNPAKPFPSVTLSTKMVEWRCDICQFNATSEPHLQGHLQGRKHIAKEKAAAETTEPVNKNAENSEASAEEAKYSNHLGMNLAKPFPSVSLSAKMLEWRCDICQFNATSEPHLDGHLQGRKHIAKEKAAAETAVPANKNDE